MRIRSIKPEFWRSDDIDALRIEDRLLFIGLWSYVDDGGIGVDKESSIAADLFAGDLDRDFHETSLRIHGGLKRLAEAGLITRYSVAGKRYLQVKTFADHQKINRPTPSKLPPPTSADAPAPEPPPRNHGGLSEDSLRARKEQGSRGAGEQGSPPTAGVAAPPQPATAQQLIGDWLDHCRKRPPGSVISQVGKSIKAMLEEGIDPTDIRGGLAAWAAKSLHPSTLPSVVNEVMNSRPQLRAVSNGTAPMQGTSSQRANAFLALRKGDPR